MDNYKPNSHKYKEDNKAGAEERQKFDKIIKGTVVTKKKSEINKLKDIFVSEDIKSVKSYILMDVLVPAIKDAIEDIVTNGIRMILRGDTSARRSSSAASKISYRDYYDGDRRNNDRFRNETRPVTKYSYDDIILESKGDAEAVLERMGEIIDIYGMVRVADLYDIVGVTGDYTDNKYGWTNISGAKPVRVRDGRYMLDLPRALPIN